MVRLESVFVPDVSELPEFQKEIYKNTYDSSDISFQYFNTQVLTALSKEFGSALINANKCLKISAHKNYCDADIIPAFSYRKYKYFHSDQNNDYIEGFYFLTNNGQCIVNFSKQHYDNLVSKSARTNGNFKETVRMLKNIRYDMEDKYLIEKNICKSYFIENLLYAVPDSYFVGNYRNRYEGIRDLLLNCTDENLSNVKCANGIDLLFSEKNWSVQNARTFINALSR